MLEVVDLHARVEGKEVLKGVNLSLREGDILVLTGPNGSGKSTLARAIAGDERVEITKGDVLLDGESILGLTPEERFKKGMFLTFQAPPEFEGIPVGSFLLRISGKGEREALEELKELVEKLGLPKNVLFRELHRGLSGGEKKRLELLQALFLKPRFVILDEIDSGVDIESIEKIVELVKELARDGSGILYITHNPRSLELLGRYKVLRMEEGRIIG